MENPIETMRKAFKDSFMQPQCFTGADIENELMQADMDAEFDKYYCRLSASGFLDCTDWSGPFDSVAECAEHLIEMYGDY